MTKITFIEPNVEVKYPWNYKNVDNKYSSFLNQIEECGRICYQSFDKITPKSGLKFSKNTISKEHWSVSEFGTLDMKLNPKYCNSQDFCYFLDDCFIRHSKLIWDDDKKDEIFLHTTLRDIYAVFIDLYSQKAFDALNMLMETLHLNKGHEYYNEDLNRILEGILPQINDKNKFIEIDVNTHKQSDLRFITKFVSNLNFTHQLVRHRKPSYLQLSRRYVRIEENFEVLDPKYIYDFSDDEKAIWEIELNNQINLYKVLLKTHRPEVARIVLPSGQMTEIIVLEDIEGWEWIWKQRDSLHADVMMRNLMKQQKEIINTHINLNE